MAKIIVELNQKGGAGKTTTTRNMGYVLSQKGKKVLQIDFDSQRNLTLCCGFEQEHQFDLTIADLMSKVINDEDVLNVVKSSIIELSDTLHIIPGDVGLAQVEMLLTTAMDRNYVLATVLESVINDYDFILIDCAPSLGLLTVNALAAGDDVLIPTEAAFLSIEGIDLLINTVFRVKRKINRELKINGILITQVDKNTKDSRSSIERITEKYSNHIKVYETQIPNRTKVRESDAAKKSIIEYDPNSDAAAAYIKFVEEFLNGESR